MDDRRRGVLRFSYSLNVINRNNIIPVRTQNVNYGIIILLIKRDVCNRARMLNHNFVTSKTQRYLYNNGNNDDIKQGRALD